MFLSNTVKAVILGLIIVLFALNRLARAYPEVGWLQVFLLPQRQMSEEEKTRRRRLGNRMAAVEMVLAGFILPVGYFGLSVMFFNEPGTAELVVVGACSLALIGLGIWVFLRNQ